MTMHFNQKMKNLRKSTIKHQKTTPEHNLDREAVTQDEACQTPFAEEATQCLFLIRSKDSLDSLKATLYELHPGLEIKAHDEGLSFCLSSIYSDEEARSKAQELYDRWIANHDIPSIHCMRFAADPNKALLRITQLQGTCPGIHLIPHEERACFVLEDNAKAHLSRMLEVAEFDSVALAFYQTETGHFIVEEEESKGLSKVVQNGNLPHVLDDAASLLFQSASKEKVWALSSVGHASPAFRAMGEKWNASSLCVIAIHNDGEPLGMAILLSSERVHLKQVAMEYLLAERPWLSLHFERRKHLQLAHQNEQLMDYVSWSFNTFLYSVDQNHNLLFCSVNPALRNLESRKCYEAFFGGEAPCLRCPIKTGDPMTERTLRPDHQLRRFEIMRKTDAPMLISAPVQSLLQNDLLSARFEERFEHELSHGKEGTILFLVGDGADAVLSDDTHKALSNQLRSSSFRESLYAYEGCSCALFLRDIDAQRAPVEAEQLFEWLLQNDEHLRHKAQTWSIAACSYPKQVYSLLSFDRFAQDTRSKRQAVGAGRYLSLPHFPSLRYVDRLEEARRKFVAEKGISLLLRPLIDTQTNKPKRVTVLPDFRAYVLTESDGPRFIQELFRKEESYRIGNVFLEAIERFLSKHLRSLGHSGLERIVIPIPYNAPINKDWANRIGWLTRLNACPKGLLQVQFPTDYVLSSPIRRCFAKYGIRVDYGERQSDLHYLDQNDLAIAIASRSFCDRIAKYIDEVRGETVVAFPHNRAERKAAKALRIGYLSNKDLMLLELLRKLKQGDSIPIV